jgi:hypothetical protein
MQDGATMKAWLAFALLVVGCEPRAMRVKSPNDNPAWSFLCSTDENCFLESKDLCPYGWDVFSSNVDSYAGEAIHQGSHSTTRSSAVRRVVIVCKEP